MLAWPSAGQTARSIGSGCDGSGPRRLDAIHRIISDGWSMGVFSQELAALYTSFLKPKTPGLPELPIQYADFAVWQREWFNHVTFDTQLSYWKKQLTAPLPVIDLP